MKAAAAPGPQRPPASRPIGLTSAPAAQLTAPLRRAALTRPHARRGRGAAGIRAARFRPRFRFLAPPGLGRHGLLPLPAPAPAPASRPAPAAALPAPRGPRLDPAFIWLTAPFSLAPPESQNNRSRAGAGRKRKAGRDTGRKKRKRKEKWEGGEEERKEEMSGEMKERGREK